MRRLFISLLICTLPTVAMAAPAAPISRHDAFVLIWDSLHRPAYDVRETPYVDVPESDAAFQKITFAKSRNILGDYEKFRPTDPVRLDEVLIWLFRTRNLADPDDITVNTLPDFLKRYQIAKLPADAEQMPTVSEDQLMHIMRLLDESLISEVHEVSLYSEKFHGKGTAFGESFDMHAMTAAHKFYPHNTLVKVTNVDNQQSVTVRINDRGPYVKGRNMDLSLGAFTTIAERSKGVIRATFHRLGDATVIGPCVVAPRFAQRITRSTILNPGVPRVLHLGDVLSLRSTKPFVVRSVTYPDGWVSSVENWILPREFYSITPSVVGLYRFRLSSVDGHSREMAMEVVKCSDEESKDAKE